MLKNNLSNKERARMKIKGYAGASGMGSFIPLPPGAPAAALMGISSHMCYEIGKIYKEDISKSEAALVAGVVGLVPVAHKIVLLELINTVPFGLFMKGSLVREIVTLLGEAIIQHYDRTTRQKVYS